MSITCAVYIQWWATNRTMLILAKTSYSLNYNTSDKNILPPTRFKKLIFGQNVKTKFI